MLQYTGASGFFKASKSGRASGCAGDLKADLGLLLGFKDAFGVFGGCGLPPWNS